MEKRNVRRFENRLYRAEVRRTTAGSPILKLTPTNPNGDAARPRQVAAFLYDLAAQLERRSDETGAEWVVSPEVSSRTITVELVGGSDREREHAEELLAEMIAENQLSAEETKR
jgi:hypothetical protein